MIDRLESIKHRYDELNTLLMDPEIITNVKKLTELSREQSHLQPVVDLFEEYKATLSTIEDLKEMAKEDDPDIIEMAKLQMQRKVMQEDLVK